MNPVALHQSMFLFKKGLRRSNHDLKVMEGKRGVTQIPNFMDLPERSKGLDIIFAWSSPRQATYEGTIENTRLTANNIFHGNGFLKSTFRSLGEISGSIWQESMRAKDVIVETDIIIEETDITNSTPMTKRRKSASESGDKILSKSGKQINELVIVHFVLMRTTMRIYTLLLL